MSSITSLSPNLASVQSIIMVHKQYLRAELDVMIYSPVLVAMALGGVTLPDATQELIINLVITIVRFL